MPKTTGVGSLFLLQQIYPNPGIELGSPALLEKEMTTHSSILVWRIPWTEEPGRLQSLGFQRVRHDWMTNNNSCIAGGFFTNWAIREARCLFYLSRKSPIQIKNCVKLIGFSETHMTGIFLFFFSWWIFLEMSEWLLQWCNAAVAKRK